MSPIRLNPVAPHDDILRRVADVFWWMVVTPKGRCRECRLHVGRESGEHDANCTLGFLHWEINNAVAGAPVDESLRTGPGVEP